MMSKVRLYLIRHGETEGNLKGEVLGQSHSSVTPDGIEQARSLGHTEWFRSTRFRLYYTSDLPRAVQTSKCVLEAASAEHSNASLILDARLRELAKGAREGFPKSTTFEQALATRREQNDGQDDALTLLETEDDCWNRIYSFTKDVLEQSLSEEDDKITNEGQNPPNIFIMTHSGILRIFLQRMIGEERLNAHPGARFDKTGLFYIPNTSVTVLDVAPIVEREKQSPYHSFHVDIVSLLGADHLSGTSIEGAYAE